MRYRLLLPAQQDLAEAMEYYEKAEPGLGLELLDEVERTISRILLQPEAWRRVSERHRRCLTRRFPYGIVYSMEKGEVVIGAVMNLRRRPNSWRERK